MPPDRPELPELLLGISTAGTRTSGIRRLADWLGCDDLLLFLSDVELQISLPAPGFRQTLPRGREWRAFVDTCHQNGAVTRELPWPDVSGMQQVKGFAGAGGSVLALIGGIPDLGRYSLLTPWLPLLISALQTERVAAIAVQRAVADRQASTEAKALAERLDAIARENGRLFFESEKNLGERQRFAALVENSADFIGLFSSTGEVLFINSSGLSMTGIQNLTEGRQRRFNDLFSPAQRSFARDHILPQVLATGRWTGETEFADCTTGVIVPVHQTTFLFTGHGEGEPILATITRDITEAKRDEEALRHRAKLESLGVMAGGIAHDFNNLLTGILGNAGLLASSVGENEVPLAEEIIKASQRAAHLTQQMLAYSGKSIFQLKLLNVSTEVREILQVVRASIAQNVSFDLQLDEMLPSINGDPGQIQQLLMNVIINAGEALNGDPGSVTISTSGVDIGNPQPPYLPGFGPLEPGRFVRLEVRDTGAGMSDNILGRIFDPFFTTKFTGRGLGLAAVSGIVRGHKGAMTVQSKIGEGTLFTILLPAATNSARADVPVKTIRARHRPYCRRGR